MRSRAFALLVRVAVAVAVLAMSPTVAQAHALQSVLVEIEEVEPGRASVHLRSSVADARVGIEVDAGCALVGGALTDNSAQADRTGTLSCDEHALSGHSVTLHGLGPVVTDGVVWARYADGSTTSHLVTRDAPSWTLPAKSTAWSTARQYVGLGVLHILGGYDHLLFLMLLVLTLRSVRAVLLAESAFTLSHSLSFTATALGWVRVSSVGAEACIAVSLVLLALDFQKDGAKGTPRARTGRAWGAAGLALLFGLVHGLGFAGGLREIGLPERDVVAALASFGAGVEIGQVAFLALALGVVHFLRRSAAWPKIELCGAYASGAVASFWVIERAAACL